MKKHILLLLAFVAFYIPQTQAQSYIVSSLATPGAATFKADEIKNGVITLPFTMTSKKIEVETNQFVTIRSSAMWCRASFSDNKLNIAVTQNNTGEARTAILTITSKDFRPLLLTVRQEAPLVFAVISDTHVGNNYGGRYAEKVSHTLQYLTSHSRLDALAVVGDLTDHGDVNQYQEFVKIFGNNENFTTPIDNFLFMMGNHDNYNSSGQLNYQNGLKAYNNGDNYPLDQYVLIKGYPFITISQRAGYNNDDNTSNGTSSYPSSVVNTLKQYLEQATKDAPGKPIFVFTHVAPRWTCYSSWGELEGIAWAMKVLNPVLNQYPQVVAFCGHSHYPLGDPRSIHQGANPNSSRNNYYTVINTASITYSEINPHAVEAQDNGIHPEGYKDVTEGMILEEQPNGDIEIRRYDTYRDVEIDPEHRWVLKAPFDGSQFQYADIRDADDNPNNLVLRDGLPAPTFENGTELTLEPGDNDVTITFPQATDNECVFRYNIRVLKNNNIVNSSFVFSQFYLTTDMPEQLSYTVDNLEGNTEYKVEVIAYDSYDNKSEALSSTFTTLNDDRPVPEAIGTWTFDNPNNLLAGTGTATLKGAIMEMKTLGVVDNLAAASITPVSGQQEGNGAISIPVGSGLMMTSNIEEQILSNYTFMFDIRSTNLNDYTALLQNDITNKQDGGFYIKNGQIGLASNGLGYNGTITSGKWHRVVFSVKNNIPTIYLDGRKIGQATSANATKWQMSTGALLFMDEDGEEHVIETSEIRFWNETLNSKQVYKLGTATGQPVQEDEPLPDAIGTWTFDNSTDPMAGTSVATLKAATHTNGNVKTYDTLTEARITTVSGPTDSNGALAIPVGSSLMMSSNMGVTTMKTYSVMWDIRATDFTGYSPLLQNSLTNAKDGSLFIKNAQVGLNGNHGMGYNGSLTSGKWHRVLFVVENNSGTVYIDGKKVGQGSACEEHWKLSTGALFFADNDGEEKSIETAEIRFWNVALTATQAEQLGKVKTE